MATETVLRSVEVALATDVASNDIVPPATTPNANAVNQQMDAFRNIHCPFYYFHAVAPLDLLIIDTAHFIIKWLHFT